MLIIYLLVASVLAGGYLNSGDSLAKAVVFGFAWPVSLVILAFACVWFVVLGFINARSEANARRFTNELIKSLKE